MDTTNKLAEELRDACTKIRVKASIPLSALIPIMQRAADALDVTPSADQATQPAEAVAWAVFDEDGRALSIACQTERPGSNRAWEPLTRPAPASASELIPGDQPGDEGVACTLDGKRCSTYVECAAKGCKRASASEPACKTCGGTRLVPDGYLYGEGGVEFSEPIACTKDCPDCASASEPDMDDAIAAGDGTLHGAIDYWQSRALAAEAARDVDETNKVLADNYLELTSASVAGAGEAPSLPSNLIQAISRYGDARADDGDSANALGDAIKAIRAWAGSLAARPVATQKGEK